MTTYKFDGVSDAVSAHQHINGGGWVADTAYVSDGSYISSNARYMEMRKFMTRHCH